MQPVPHLIIPFTEDTSKRFIGLIKWSLLIGEHSAS